MKHLLFILLLFPFLAQAGVKEKSVQSPDGKIEVRIQYADSITYTIFHESEQIINSSSIDLVLKQGIALGKNPKIIKTSSRSVNQTLTDSLANRRNYLNDVYNELTLDFREGFSLIFRAYNEGFAYRFKTTIPDSVTVMNEVVEFNIKGATDAIYIPKKSCWNDGEGNYSTTSLSAIPDSIVALAPMLVKLQNGLTLALTESELIDYPGLHFSRKDELTVKGSFLNFYTREIKNYWSYEGREFAPYIAKTVGTRLFPWRVAVIAENEKQLADCDLVYKLAAPCAIPDVSWIKPGKAAWDWWYDWVLEGVVFKADTSSMDFYKYVIDWAGKNKLEYIELSLGWTKGDLFDELDPRLNVKELVEYGKKQNVGILIWVVAYDLNRNWDKCWKWFTDFGVAGLKVDFMEGDHQGRVNFYERVYKECAKNKMLVYFHGAHKPTGIERTYPNIINYESVTGNEYNKGFWNGWVTTPEHCLTLPFARNLAGRMDFTPGGMRNVHPRDFHYCMDKPMVMGTRCFQLAQYINFIGSSQMVCDAPSAYNKEQDALDFISKVPTIWDESVVLDAKIGQLLVTARQKGMSWFVGGMSTSALDNYKVNLGFLEKGKQYTADVYRDGINADRIATDYKRYSREVKNTDTIDLNVVAGGGFVIVISEL